MNENNYDGMIKRARSLTEGAPGLISAMANLSALLFLELGRVNWAGFYLVEDGRLVLGPFQGKPACTEIAIGRGVCGTAVSEEKIQLVPDVNAFPGHIACDSASRSELVIPVRGAGRVIAVLDIDSAEYSRFTEADAAALARIADMLGEAFGG